MSQASKKYLMIGGLAVAVSGLAYYFLNKKETKVDSQVQQVDKQTMLKIFKDFDKEFYNVFQNMAVFAIQISQQTQGRVPLDEIKAYLLQDPSLQQEIQKLEDKIYAKFNMTEEQFRSAVEGQFKEDQDVQSAQSKFEAQINSACQGVVPDYQCKLPDFMDFRQTLSIFTEIMLSSTLHIHQAMSQAKEKGITGNPMQSPEIQQALNPMILEQKKQVILAKYGLDNFEENPAKIFTCAMQTYMKQNKDFDNIFKVIEQYHQKVMISIFKNELDSVDKLEQDYQSLLKSELEKLDKKEQQEREVQALKAQQEKDEQALKEQQEKAQEQTNEEQAQEQNGQTDEKSMEKTEYVAQEKAEENVQVKEAVSQEKSQFVVLEESKQENL